MTIRARRDNDFVDVPKEIRSVFITERDMQVLRSLWVYGVLADYQIDQLEFSNTKDMKSFKRRATELWNGGYIRRLTRAGTLVYGCNVYWLTRKGAEVVNSPPDYPYPREPVWSQLTHDIVAADVAITINIAAAHNPLMKVIDWLPESAFRSDRDTITYKTLEGMTRKRQVIPDIFFHVERQREDGGDPFRSRLLIEVDMGQHRMRRLSNEKLLAGTAYLRSDQYEKRFGRKSGRWLFVTTSHERLAIVKAEAEKILGRDAEVWYFGVMEDLTPETFLTVPVWYKGLSSDSVALFPS